MSSEPVVLHFPSELLYTILSYLRDDKPLLASCSLVSRSWCEPSRAHLFDFITLSPSQLHKFEDTLNAAPVLGRAIRSLRVVPDDASLANLEFPISPLNIPQLHSLLHKLPGLRFLLLARVQPFGRLTLQPRLNDIESFFVLAWASPDAIPSLVDLVRSFRRVGSLRLRLFEMEKSRYDGIVGSVAESSAERATQIEELKLDASPMEIGLRDTLSPCLHTCQLLYRVAIVNQCSLIFGGTVSHPLETLALLRMVSSSLVGLDITIHSSYLRRVGDPGWESVVDFPEFPRLTTLLFCMNIYGYALVGGPEPSLDDDLHSALDACATTISRVSGNVEIVWFSMWITHASYRNDGRSALEHLTNGGWSSVRHALKALKRFQKMCVVTPLWGETQSAIQDLLERMLPEMHENGQLEYIPIGEEII